MQHADKPLVSIFGAVFSRQGICVIISESAVWEQSTCHRKRLDKPLLHRPNSPDIQTT